MEKSVEVNGGNVPHSERRNPRRRLIQSTLFQQKSQINEDNGKGEEDDEDDEEDEEYCGSQSKRKRKNKGKAKTRTPKKAPVTGKEASERRSENRKSLLTVGSDFFLKASERKLQQKQLKEHGGVSLAEGNNNISTDLESVVGKRSCMRLKLKWEGDASPCKDVTLGDLGGPNCRRIVTNNKFETAKGVDIQSEHSPEPVDLWLEAKIAAEENTRLFTGRQEHPFFSSWKMGRRSQDTSEATELDSKRLLSLQEGKSISCRPIHVFEMLQDDLVPLDWRSWIFYDRISFTSGCAPEHVFSSVFEGSVGPLKFDDFHSLSNSVGSSLLRNDASLSHSPGQVKDMYPISLAVSSMPADGKVSHHHQLEHLQMVHKRYKGGLPLGYTGPVPVISLDSELPDGFLSERIKSYYLDCGSQPNSSLWTSKYQPEKAFEVCGNGESVRFLHEWLCSWGARYSQTHKISTRGSKCIIQDNDCSWNENDSDTESMDGEVNLKNVLLVTGPVGSGKSAAIYACAKEQGFRVIEVSASDWRNGAHVRQKFGEAMESLGINKWSLEDTGGSRRKHIPECASSQPGNSSIQDVDDEVVELISEMCAEETDNVKQGSNKIIEKVKITSCGQGLDKTLILFEDVDTVFDEDRGFIATIQQISETAKRPMILTSNSKDPVLPYQLDRLEVCFTVPLPGELLSHLCMVCAAEEADLQPQLIERFIESCHGDIRKTIMLLQFWCQGRNKKDGKCQCAHVPLQVDLDAGHWVVPKVIPWGFPCQLAELVEKEITGTLSSVKEDALLEVVEEEEFSSEEIQDALGMGIEAKKEAMLRRNCSIHDDNEFSARFDVAAELSNSSSSPVTFTWRASRRRPSTVLSSQSGDEFCNDKIPVSSGILSGVPSNELLLGVSGNSLDQKMAIQDYPEPSIGQLHNSERELSQQNSYKCSETEGEQRICDTYKSVSCVPESSFVLETEINDEAELLSKTVSCGHIAVSSEAVTLNGAKSIHSLSAADINNLDKHFPELDKNSETLLRSTSVVDAELVRGEEEVGDSQIAHAETVTKDYQGMDECSRADFNMGCISVENCKCSLLAGSVQETWRKLRNCHADLKSYVTSEQKDASKIVKLASGMTDLISVADLMLGCCQPLISDSLEPSMVPCVEPDASCWYHKQLDISSTVVQHGFCFFAKECAAKGSSSGFRNSVDLACEMLAFTNNTTALGKLVTQDMSTGHNSYAGSSGRPPKSVISSKREVEAHLYNTIQNIVPSKSWLSLKGAAFHEYASSLGQISRLEASRLLKNIDSTKQQRRRARATQHYLSTGQLMLSPEDVSLLAQHSCYGKLPLDQ